MPYLTAKLQGFGTTIFAEMSALAVATDSVNLGQGFPDTDGPREVLDAAIAAINGGLNQYPPGPGMPALATCSMWLCGSKTAYCMAACRRRKSDGISRPLFSAR